MEKLVPIPKRSPWVTQWLVISALIRREVSTRLGQYKLGFFWILFDPLMSVIVMGLVLGGLLGRTVPEIPYPFFVLQGMLLLRLLTGAMNCGINAIGANKGLLVYPSVRPLDTFIARFLFEFVITLLAFVVFTAVGMWLGVDVSLHNLGSVFACYFITWLVGCGLGLICGMAVLRHPDIDKVVAVFQRPLIFLSAVLFPTGALPQSAQEILFYNPLVHTIELSRQAMFPHYVEHGANLAYPFVFAVILLSLGLVYFHRSRNLLTSR